MLILFKVLSSSGKTTEQDDVYGNRDVRYLTLGHKNPGSGNRYYVRLSGKDADIEWQEGDAVMVELGFCAYKTRGQWHMSHRNDAMELIEIDTNSQRDLQHGQYEKG